MKKKIVILGAGPIGCYTAQILKVYGVDSLLIEEHAEVGRPVHCTGLVGSSVFSEKRPYKLSQSSIINVINGAVMHYDGQSFNINRKNVAYVIDRERFDKELSLGLKIVLENKLLGIKKLKAGYIVETDKQEFPADIVIGADGANSTVRKILGFDGNIKQYRGVQFRLKLKTGSKDLVHVYMSKPSFFWVVPESEDIVRIGTISENPHYDLEQFLRANGIKGELLERFGGLTSLGICAHTVKDNIALVGDAACQVKPLTYGGIYFGLKSATTLADCIRKNRIKDYDALWKKELVSEIKIGLRAKETYGSLTNDELGSIFKLLKSQKALIEKVGNFENHSQVIFEILKKPSAYPQLGSLFSLLLKKIL